MEDIIFLSESEIFLEGLWYPSWYEQSGNKTWLYQPQSLFISSVLNSCQWSRKYQTLVAWKNNSGVYVTKTSPKCIPPFIMNTLVIYKSIQRNSIVQTLTLYKYNVVNSWLSRQYCLLFCLAACTGAHLDITVTVSVHASVRVPYTTDNSVSYSIYIGKASPGLHIYNIFHDPCT